MVFSLFNCKKVDTKIFLKLRKSFIYKKYFLFNLLRHHLFALHLIICAIKVLGKFHRQTFFAIHFLMGKKTCSSIHQLTACCNHVRLVQYISRFRPMLGCRIDNVADQRTRCNDPLWYPTMMYSPRTADAESSLRVQRHQRVDKL